MVEIDVTLVVPLFDGFIARLNVNGGGSVRIMDDGIGAWTRPPSYTVEQLERLHGVIPDLFWKLKKMQNLVADAKQQGGDI